MSLREIHPDVPEHVRKRLLRTRIRSRVSQRVCPTCGGDDTQCYDSRGTASGRYVRRRVICVGCAHRWTTIEVATTEAEAAAHSPIAKLSSDQQATLLKIAAVLWPGAVQ